MGKVIYLAEQRAIRKFTPPPLTPSPDAHDCSRCRELEVALKLAEADVARLAKDGWVG